MRLYDYGPGPLTYSTKSSASDPSSPGIQTQSPTSQYSRIPTLPGRRDLTYRNGQICKSGLPGSGISRVSVALSFLIPPIPIRAENYPLPYEA
jgi:hypothetical protein